VGRLFFGNDLPQPDYEALVELLDIQPQKIRPWKNAAEFQDIVISAVAKGERRLAGREFDKNQLKNLCAFLIRAENIARERRFFHWELEFPEVFFNEDGTLRNSPGFDAVIRNPPWGGEFDEPAKHYNRLTFAPTIVRMVDSFMFFVYRALGLTRSSGYESQIVPSAFLLQGDIKKLRQNLLRRSLTKVVNLGDGVFGPDVIAPCCIFALLNEGCDPDKELVDGADLTKVSVPEKPLKLSGDAIYRRVPQSFYLSTHNFAFITKGFEAAPIVSKAKQAGIPLAQCIHGEIQRGISADYNKAFIVTDFERRTKRLESTICMPVVTGQDITRYTLSWKGNYVLYLTRNDSIEAYPQAKAHLQGFRGKITCKEVKAGKHPWFALHRERDRQLFKAAKIVGLTTTDRLTVALDTQGYMATDALYIFRLPEKTSLSASFLIALLNSRLMTFIYRYFAQEEGRVLAQIKADNLYPLPIREIDFSRRSRESTARADEGKRLYEQLFTGSELQECIEFCEERLREGDTDIVHDFLAFLADRMIELNEKKRAAATEFLTDLKDFHGIDVGSLSPKTKLHEFWKLEAADLFAHFQANKVRLKASDEEKIRERFSRAKSELIAIDSQIAFTDRLIDKIVYRLYDLTPKEIQIVEGASAKAAA
jgi:hypothetical protein